MLLLYLLLFCLFKFQFRHKSDQQVNNRQSQVLIRGRYLNALSNCACDYISVQGSLSGLIISFFSLPSLQNEKWMNVRVGDIIKLENNQFVAVS